MRKVIVFIVGLVWLGNMVRAGEFVEFVIPHEMDADSAMAFVAEPIRGQADRLVVKEGHFYRGNQRERLWGVNSPSTSNKQPSSVVSTSPVVFGAFSRRCNAHICLTETRSTAIHRTVVRSGRSRPRQGWPIEADRQARITGSPRRRPSSLEFANSSGYNGRLDST